jgi:hypothetical protein
MGVGGQRHTPATLPPGKTPYPLYRRLGGRQDRSGRMRKISPPPGFDPRTVQPVASRYTNCAIPAHAFVVICCKCGLLSPSRGYPILRYFEESALEPTVRFNRQPANWSTGFSRFHLNEANSSNQCIFARSDFPSFS